MESDWSIRAEGLCKKFGLTLRESMLYGVRDSLRRLAGLRVASQVLRPGEFWALRTSPSRSVEAKVWVSWESTAR